MKRVIGSNQFLWASVGGCLLVGAPIVWFASFNSAYVATQAICAVLIVCVGLWLDVRRPWQSQ